MDHKNAKDQLVTPTLLAGSSALYLKNQNPFPIMEIEYSNISLRLIIQLDISKFKNIILNKETNWLVNGIKTMHQSRCSPKLIHVSILVLVLYMVVDKGQLWHIGNNYGVPGIKKTLGCFLGLIKLILSLLVRQLL